MPPSVWVHVDEVRCNMRVFLTRCIMVRETHGFDSKIVIAGPEGTSYEGGLFEFDCFMPLEYPNVPPLVRLRTTGGGRLRFNPNLHNCSSVSLSLLGTWAGW